MCLRLLEQGGKQQRECFDCPSVKLQCVLHSSTHAHTHARTSKVAMLSGSTVAENQS